MQDEVQFLRQKVSSWTEGIRTGRVPNKVAWYCLNSTIMKTIRYPLTATNFSRRDTQQFMQPLLKVALNSCGVQRRLPRALVYGTLRARGLGIRDPFWSQLIQHCQVILRQTHRVTPTSMLLDETMELVQLHVGSKINFWELPFPAYGFLAPVGWMKHTWESMSSSTLVLKGPAISIPRRRQRDVYLMDAFVDTISDQTTLKQINECRLFLHATTLSDISTADGTSIDPCAWFGQRLYS